MTQPLVNPPMLQTSRELFYVPLVSELVEATAQQPFRNVGQEGPQGSWFGNRYPALINLERSQHCQGRLVVHWRMNVTQITSQDREQVPPPPPAPVPPESD